jgi:hypothetical protein
MQCLEMGMTPGFVTLTVLMIMIVIVVTTTKAGIAQSVE